MKYYISALAVSLLLSSKLNAQDTLVTYHNAEWEKVESKAEATHYRHSYETEKGVYAFKSYYMTGELKAEGYYKKKNYKKFNGPFSSYHKNGTKSSSGQFSADLKTGKWSYWYENGVLQNETQYNIEGEKHGRYVSWFEDSIMDSEGDFLNDKTNGDWKYYFENGQLASHEIYKAGELVSFTYWNEKGKRLKGDDLKLYQHIEYHTGSKGISNYIRANFVYPPKAMSLGVEGKVKMVFTVEKNGELSGVEITGSENEDFRAEAKKLSKGLVKWIPAKYHNRTIQSTYTIPVTFKLR